MVHIKKISLKKTRVRYKRKFTLERLLCLIKGIRAMLIKMMLVTISLERKGVGSWNLSFSTPRMELFPPQAIASSPTDDTTSPTYIKEFVKRKK